MSNIQVDGDADIQAAVFGNENQIVSDVGKVAGRLIQALLHSDVHIGIRPRHSDKNFCLSLPVILNAKAALRHSCSREVSQNAYFLDFDGLDFFILQ